MGAYTYTAKHPQAVSKAGGVNYAYDLNGSLITSTQGASMLSYNDRGRLASTSVNGKQVSYVYDEGGERTAKVAGSVTDTYVNQYYEEELNGLVKDKRKFIYAGPIKVATINPDKSIAFHHEDHLSGASLTTNQKGNVIETVDYFPYGQVRIEEKSEGYKNDYLFTGQERDEETGLMYYGARYYDARVGRFAMVDPWEGDMKDPQSLNKYSYVRNNPLKYNDPTGKSWDTLKAGFAYAAAVVVAVANPVVDFVAAVAVTAVAMIAIVETVKNVITEVAPPTPKPQPSITPAPAPEVKTVDTIPAPAINMTPYITPANDNVMPEWLGTVSTSEDAGCGVYWSCSSAIEDQHSLGPLEGIPNSTKLRWLDGKINQGRTFDSEGNPVVDIDFSDHGNPDLHPEVPHTHEWKENPETGEFERQ